MDKRTNLLVTKNVAGNTRLRPTTGKRDDDQAGWKSDADSVESLPEKSEKHHRSKLVLRSEAPVTRDQTKQMATVKVPDQGGGGGGTRQPYLRPVPTSGKKNSTPQSHASSSHTLPSSVNSPESREVITKIPNPKTAAGDPNSARVTMLLQTDKAADASRDSRKDLIVKLDSSVVEVKSEKRIQKLESDLEKECKTETVLSVGGNPKPTLEPTSEMCGPSETAELPEKWDESPDKQSKNRNFMQRAESARKVPGKDKPRQSVIPLRHGVDLSFLKDLKTKHKFSVAFDQQNQVAASAIKSLDSLNDQIVQYIFGQADHHGNAPPLDLHLHPQPEGQGGGAAPDNLSPGEQDNLQTSIVLIRRLLQDAQGKFRKMVEENKQLAVRIDGSIQSANQEVHALRAELADTNKRLSKISTSAEDVENKGGGGGGREGRDVVLPAGLKETDIDCCCSGSSGTELLDGGGGGDGDLASTKEGVEKSDVNKEEVTARKTDFQDCSDGSVLRERGLLTGCQVAEDSLSDPSSVLISRLRVEKLRLESQVRSLCQEVTSLKSGLGEGGADGHPSYGDLKLDLIQTRQELNRAKEALQAMKSDRKRLKIEKVDLLHQMKQLYVTLEDKESELRDFIRNYEQRVQESDESIKQLAQEKEDSEREKWEIIKKARESAERSVILRTQLDARDQTIRDLQEEIAKLKLQLAERGLDDSRDSNNTTPTPADDNGHDAGVITPTTVPITTTAVPGSSGDHIRKSSSLVNALESTGSESGSCHTPDGFLSKESSFSGDTPLSTPTFSHHGNESLSSLMKWMALSSDGSDGDCKNSKKKKKGFGSLSRVFGRSRTRRSIALPHNESLFEDGSGLKMSLLTPDNYQEKLQTVEAMSGLHMCQWRAGQVLAWLEITLGMPMYGRNCALNIKSGKVLLGLSDSELGTALGITNHIHKRKLRLAIEEHRDPAVIKYAQAPNLDVTWVAHKLLPELGLPQYSQVFERNLVDGRILNSLTRRDLEKYFDIHRKFHQASILHAVELLRRMEFDREKLAERRGQCEDSDSDLIVWTFSRLVRWIRSIDLGEFAENLHESGVHGALMVLEPSFNSDTLATALAIPPSKSYIRRHLTTELETLLRPARAALDTPNNNSKHLDPGGKGHTFTRSYRGQSSDDGSKGRLSFRGSLGRAFGKKIRDDLKLAFDSESPKWKISAPIPIQHTSLDNVVEIPGDSTAV